MLLLNVTNSSIYPPENQHRKRKFVIEIIVDTSSKGFVFFIVMLNIGGGGSFPVFCCYPNFDLRLIPFELIQDVAHQKRVLIFTECKWKPP